MEKRNRALLLRTICWLTLIGWTAGYGRSIRAAESPVTNPPPAPAPSAIAGREAGLVQGVDRTSVSNGTNATNRSSASVAAVAEELTARYSAEILRSYLRLQEQLHATLLAIQQTRADASVEAQTNTSAMLGRLETLEKELAGQRAEDARIAREFHETRDSNRLIMMSAAGLFLIGLMAMVLTAIIQARGMNRLAEIAMGLGPARGFPGLPGPTGHAAEGSLALPSGERLLIGSGENGLDDAGPGRLQSTIGRLENRIREMEVANRTGTTVKNGHADDSAAPSDTSASGPSEASAREVVLARTQALLSLGRPQAALGAMDEAIAQDPNDSEMHLHRGMALERLKRFDQAIESYDRAIALDLRCTQAYLSKGAVLNQQSRFQEALACYEQALEHRERSA